MNLLKNKLASKLMLAAIMLFGSSSMFAANKIYLGDLPAIQTYDEVRLPVMMDCDDEAVGFHFDVILPESLIIKGIDFNTERKADHTATAGIKNGIPNFLVQSPSFSPFVGNTGVIAYIRVKVADGALKVPSAPMIKLDKIKISAAAGRPLEAPSSDEKQIYIGKVSRCLASFGSDLSNPVNSSVINPEGKLTVTFGLDNTVVAQGMQLDVTLPEGFTFDCNTGGFIKFTNGTRLTTNSAPSGKPKNNKVTIWVSNDSNFPIIDKDNNNTDEALFSFDIIAPAEFASPAEVVISNALVSLPGSEGIESAAEGVTLEVINGSEVKKNADAEVTKLKDALTAALAEIAEKYADVKDQFTGEEIATEITNLETAINAAYEDLSLKAKYEEIMKPVAGIQEKIDALVPAAAEAVRVAANEAAHKAEIDAIDTAAAKLEAALAKVKEAYPDYNTEADVKAVNDAVAAAKAAADDALKAVEKEGTYNHQLDAKPIEDAIAAIEKNAKADADAKAEAARVAANKAAYEKDLADIKPFESQLAMVLAKVADNKDYDVTADKAAAEKAITDAKEAAAANLAAVKDEGEYKSTLDVAKIAAAITAIEKNAAAATAEAARVAANKAAYDKDVEDLKALQTKLDAAVESVKGNENYDSAADAKAAQDLIDAAKAAADKDFAAVAEEGNYKSTLDAAAIEAAIAAIAKNADDASLQAVNDKAKANADAAVAALKDNLAAAVADIKENCPDVADLFNGEAENAAIAGLESAIAAAYEGKTLAADYDKVMAPAATIEEAIKTLKSEAEAAQKAAEAEAKRVADNKAAYDAEMALIQQLRDELQAEIDKFKENGWENDLFNERKNVSDYIDGLENKVKSENNRVIPSDTYANQLKDSDMEMARGLIKEYVQKVQTSGIDSIVADEELGNARIYTIDGVQHSRLVPGVNIIVKADGTTTKVYVK